MDCTIGVGQLRAHTCTYMQMVAGGETLRVLRRGRLVALIRPVPGPPSESVPSDLTPVDLSSFRTQASRHLDHVSAGSRLCVVHHGRAVAEVIQASPSS